MARYHSSCCGFCAVRFSACMNSSFETRGPTAIVFASVAMWICCSRVEGVHNCPAVLGKPGYRVHWLRVRLEPSEVKLEDHEIRIEDALASQIQPFISVDTPVRAQRRSHSTVASAVACTRPLGKSRMQCNQIGSAGRSRTNGQSGLVQCNRASGYAKVREVEAKDNADELCSRP
jgi:hypothetical protein